MDKIAVGPEAAGLIDIEAPVADNLAKVAKAKGTGSPTCGSSSSTVPATSTTSTPCAPPEPASSS